MFTAIHHIAFRSDTDRTVIGRKILYFWDPVSERVVNNINDCPGLLHFPLGCEIDPSRVFDAIAGTNRLVSLPRLIQLCEEVGGGTYQARPIDIEEDAR